MVRNLFSTVPLAFVLVACDSVEGSGAALSDGGDPADVASPMDLAGGTANLTEMTVTVPVASGPLTVTVVRPGPEGVDTVLAHAPVVDGEAVVLLPENPLATGDWKVAVRMVTSDGRPGNYLDVAQSPIFYNAINTPEIPAGWWIRGTANEPGLHAAETGMTLGSRLAPITSSVMAGEIVPELEELDFAIGFSAVFRGQELAVATENYGVEETTFGVGVQGSPIRFEGNSNPIFVSYWPVAWTEVDGVEGFSTTGDHIVGVTCADGKPVGFGWTAPATTLSRANALLKDGVRPGWTRVRVAEKGVEPLAPDAVVTLDVSCDE